MGHRAKIERQDPEREKLCVCDVMFWGPKGAHKKREERGEEEERVWREKKRIRIRMHKQQQQPITTSYGRTMEPFISPSPTNPSGNEWFCLKYFGRACLLAWPLLLCTFCIVVYYLLLLSLFSFCPHIFLSVVNGRTRPCPRSCEQERNFATVGQSQDNWTGLDNWTNTQTCAAYAHSQRKEERDRPEKTETEKGR